ncbi:MAG: co-chaperone GroES [Clostridiales bacterium]|nr:co-chaperone GroES [Clostridiales bacterium]
MKLVPLGDKVVIKQMEAEEKTKSGIVLPSQSKEKPQMASVIAVGNGDYVEGKKIEMIVKPGDKVIYSRYAGTEVELEGEKLLVVRQGDILAIVED